MIERKKSIVSYGIVLCSVSGNIVKYLLCQRRDTYGYMDFLRGVWTTNSSLFRLFEGMTEDERYRIRWFTFDELWDDLWVDHTSSIYNTKGKARKKYDVIKQHIPFILQNTRSKCNESPWCFPKGKKNYNETHLRCAIREFSEETRIKNKFKILANKTFCELYKDNGKYYETQYFLGISNILNLPSKVKINRIRKETLTDECSDVKWFTFEEAISKLVHKRVLEYIQNYVVNNFF